MTSQQAGSAHEKRHPQGQQQRQPFVGPPADSVYITTAGTTPEALLRLIRQRWSIENEWHWSRDTQLGEDAHRYANRIGAPVFAFLRTVAMNPLRRSGYRSIRRGIRELAYAIKGMFALGGAQVQPAENAT
jgi:predicted transposase YbfD/YdcC